MVSFFQRTEKRRSFSAHGVEHRQRRVALREPGGRAGTVQKQPGEICVGFSLVLHQLRKLFRVIAASGAGQRSQRTVFPQLGGKAAASVCGNIAPLRNGQFWSGKYQKRLSPQRAKLHIRRKLPCIQNAGKFSHCQLFQRMAISDVRVRLQEHSVLHGKPLFTGIKSTKNKLINPAHSSISRAKNKIKHF